MHIKKGDQVIVLAGKDKGKSGKVVKAIPKIGKVVVEGINMVKKHQKPRKQGQVGQVVDISMPIQVSNLAVKK